MSTAVTERQRRHGAAASSEAPARRRRRSDLKLALLFIAPALIGFVVFFVWPTIRGHLPELHRRTTCSPPPQLIGLDNYLRMVQDPVFWNALKVTLEYVVINIGVQTVLALVIAVLMQRLTKSTWLRGILLTPYLIANVVVALVWLWMLDYQLGIVNQILAWIGLDRIPFLADSDTGSSRRSPSSTSGGTSATPRC